MINHMFVSRAATAIYLVLKANAIMGSKVLLPANICYAAIYPVIYSGNIPVFCDVNKENGNVDRHIISQYLNEVRVMVLPHMYGNPIQDIEEIKNLCARNGILLIEDCASAMGATVQGKRCGSWGDYSIFSTGYSKTLDIGAGGILVSGFSLDKEKEIYEVLDEKTDVDEINEAFYSKLYRLIRNAPQQTLSPYIWRGLYDNMFGVFIHKLSGIGTKIEEALPSLDTIIQQREEKLNIYRKELKDSVIWQEYHFFDGAVPWRYCMLVDKDYRRDLIDYALQHDLPVSDWYPDVTPIFGKTDEFPGAKYMEERLINFPLIIENDEILKISHCLNEFLQK